MHQVKILPNDNNKNLTPLIITYNMTNLENNESGIIWVANPLVLLTIAKKKESKNVIFVLPGVSALYSTMCTKAATVNIRNKIIPASRIAFLVTKENFKILVLDGTYIWNQCYQTSHKSKMQSHKSKRVNLKIMKWI